ncbi:Flavin-Reduct domain-containing protein [Mycena venus]|uniref:Flavin-Reduct domain-containing protein n=1 Tax=Mycena venus TaxID=2733690 RepID=A0A8H6XUV7_9AGAR|nr:Flavin-Reduct domain-containing protein [Mycena venus]
MSDSDLPSFNTSGFKYTQSPHPSWTYGEPVTATAQGQKWAEDGEEGWKSFNTSEEDPKVIYGLCTTGIVPRPVAFVSTVAEDGSENLAPFSWFNQVSTNPCVISVSCTTSPRHKDTAQNIKATKEFTVNIISEPWVAQASSTSIDAPPSISEWTFSGLTQEPSVSVKPARVKESAFALECELLQNVEIKNAAGALATNLILGTVKYIHVRKAVLNEKGVVDPAKLKAIGRMGDITFISVKDGFRVPRRSWAQDKEEIVRRFNSSL